MRMLSRSKYPPGEWQLLLPEIGMKAPITGGFVDVCDQFARIIRSNPAQAEKYGWPLDSKGQENYVDAQNAQRCAQHGWMNFIELQAPDAPFSYDPAQKKTWLQSAVGSVKATQAALAAWQEMFGDRGPVPREVAEPRAAICAACPKNEPGSYFDRFVQETAAGMMALLGVTKDLSMRTVLTDKPATCSACDCPTFSKVWAHSDTIARHTTEEQWQALNKENPKCWMLTESGR